jgi:Sterol desaturase
LAVLLFGIGPIMLVVFFATFEGATLFHHSNWRLPIRVERFLNLILITPRMHGIHHSIVQRETNSNWGTMFCWWDKLHRTLRRDVAQDAITIGVAAYREENELTLGKLFALPFRAQREWRLPNGEVQSARRDQRKSSPNNVKSAHRVGKLQMCSRQKQVINAQPSRP